MKNNQVWDHSYLGTLVIKVEMQEKELYYEVECPKLEQKILGPRVGTYY